MNVNTSACNAAILSLILIFVYLVVHFWLKMNDKQKGAISIIVWRVIFFLFFSVSPFVFLSNKELLKEVLFTHIEINKLFFVLAIFIPVILIINYKQSRKESHQNAYPVIKLKRWSSGFYIFNIVSWLLYLLAYEFVFRGLLLFNCMEVVGVYWAILINSTVYALAHIFKGRFETMGAFPLGMVFCIITMYTNHFITAFILHAVMAISNDILCIHYHPEKKLWYQ